MRGGENLTFWRYYPRFFSIDLQDLTGYFGKFSPAHLWFILFLLIIALLVLPLLLWLRSKRGQVLVQQLAIFSTRPGAIFLWPAPLAAAEAVPDLGGKNMASYAIVFLYGFLCMSDVRFIKTLSSHRLAALLLGLALTPLTIITWPWFNSFPDFSGPSILFALVYTLNTWSWLIAITGYGVKFLNQSNKMLRYSSEAAYPAYILHQTVIVIAAALIVQWSWPLWIKFTVIAILSLAVTVFIYDLLIKRLKTLRCLFGLKATPAARTTRLLNLKTEAQK